VTDSERTLRHIEALLVKIADRLGVKPEPKRESKASVAAFNTVTGDSGDLANLPSQLEHTMIETPLGDKYRRVTRIKGDPR